MNRRVNVYMVSDMKSNIMQVSALPEENTQGAAQNYKLGTNSKYVMIFQLLHDSLNNQFQPENQWFVAVAEL